MSFNSLERAYLEPKDDGTVCEECSKVYGDDEGHSSPDGHDLCDDCFDNHGYKVCCICDMSFEPEYNEQDEFCPSCFEGLLSPDALIGFFKDIGLKELCEYILAQYEIYVERVELEGVVGYIRDGIINDIKNSSWGYEIHGQNVEKYLSKEVAQYYHLYKAEQKKAVSV